MIQTSSNSALLAGSEICLENPGEKKNLGRYGALQFQQMRYMRCVRTEHGIRAEPA